MLFRNVTSNDLDVVLRTDLSNQIPHPVAKTSFQHRLAVFRRPHQMVFQIKGGVGTGTVEFHPNTISYLKGPPEGGGFAPKDG